MLKENDAVRKMLNVDAWHKAGYTGKGVTIALIDVEGKARENMQGYFLDPLGTQKEIGHATNVGFTAHEFAPDAKVLVFRSRQESFDWIAARKDEIDLINVSMSGVGTVPVPIFLQYEKLGIPIICASGNDDYDDKIAYPAAYPFTIAIGATNRDGKKAASYSNEGAKLDAAAPGNVYIQRDDGYTWNVWGTSFAAPTVAGMLACYIQWRKEHGMPALTPEEARTFIHENCIDIEEKGFDYASGHGLFCLPEISEIKEGEEVSTPYKRNIQAIVIHHMGDNLPPGISILKRWNPYNYDYPEYDFGIEADGTIRKGRPLTVIGSHTKCDKEPYLSNRGQWWFNRNAIGIGLAGDFTRYPMPEAQFKALVALVRRLMTEHWLTLANVYPHGQVAYTGCPGCTYSKVPALRGLWSYDEFEQALMGDKKEEADVLKVAVLLNTKEDFWAGTDVAAVNSNCGIFIRGADRTAPADAWNAEKLIVVGGASTGHKNEVLLSGNDKYDTAAAVKKYLG